MLKQILLILTLTSNLIFAQNDLKNAYSASSSDLETEFMVLPMENRDYVYNSKDDQMFAMHVIKKIDDNTYWIKKGKIYSNEDKVLLELSDFLYNSKGEKVIDQVRVQNGYIIEFLEDNPSTTTISVSIADQNGERYSDELIFNTIDLKDVLRR